MANAATGSWWENPENITMLAHVMGGMGENISAGSPVFQGVPQSLVRAQNMAQLLNRLGGGTTPTGTTKGGKPTDNNPDTPTPVDRMKLAFDGTPNDLTNTLMSMSFGGGGSEILNQAMGGIGFAGPLTPQEKAIPYGGPTKVDPFNTSAFKKYGIDQLTPEEKEVPIFGGLEPEQASNPFANAMGGYPLI